MIQQSNCFLVVERGLGMQNLMQERALSKSGELRQDSNMGGGQMVTADYVLTPAVVFSQDDAGGTLARGEELIFMGKEKDGFVSVETSRGGGWVKKVLIAK
ncbi:MAG TPA: CsgG/HfaB family protein [Candidatus Acidoferrum sp.]|nr:CsgG/HfaB family protein [Candidatus Acidoferrum sp.]